MDDFLPLIALIIPIVAVIGGILLAIVRILTQGRLEELARRERIAAIERGVDPEKLPALPGAGPDFYGWGGSRLRRAHGLLIGGLIVVAVGISISVIFLFLEPRENQWIIGLLPTMVGIALLSGSWIVWPRKTA